MPRKRPSGAAVLVANAARQRKRSGAAATVIDARSQKAWRAVRQLTSMLPTFTSFARLMSGNKNVRVQLGDHGARTDGKTIWIFPPISLGEERTHQHHLCDKRGPDRRQLCSACDAREQVLFNLFHEIAHISFDSLVEPIQYVVDLVCALIEEWHPVGACNHAALMIHSARNAKTNLDLAASHNGFLQILVKALEDARVNSSMFKVRPGLRVMFDAEVRRVFSEGVEASDGTHNFWRDADLNAQVITGLLLMASGYGQPEGYLSDEANVVLSDAELQRLSGRAVRCQTVHQITELVIEVFRRLNSLGFCLVPKCEVTPPIPAPPSEPGDEEKDANQSTDGSPGSDGGSPSDTESSDDAESSDGAGDSSDDDSGSDDDAAGDDGEPKDQQDPDAGPSSSDPADADQFDDGSADEGDDETKGGSGGGSGTQSTDDTADDDEDAPSTDGALRGSDDEDDSPEGEDGSDSEPQASGAGSSHSGTGDDPAQMDASPGAQTPEDEGEGTPDDDDREDGELDPSSARDPGDDDTDQLETEAAGTEEGSTNSDEPGDPDVSEDIWNDEDNAKAAEDQYGNTVDPGDPSDYGDPADVAEVMRKFNALCDQHEADELARHDPSMSQEEAKDLAAVQLAMLQGAHFETARAGVGELLVVEHPHVPSRWVTGYLKPENFLPTEALMGRALLAARLAFEDNQRADEVRNLKGGRLDRRAVGKRAPVGDPRMFYKRTRPGRQSYFFAIGLDLSGSTLSYGRNPRILRSAFAQATLLSRLGHKFAIYGMTGGRNLDDLGDPDYYLLNDVWVFRVKSPDEPWSRSVQQKLADLKPCNENFDGHNIEFLRKVLDSRTETSRGIIYYTDGAMPARNAEEELAILTNELTTCRKRGYAVLGVGMNTDSPRQYGLDTVQVDSDEDVILVTRQLGAHLAKR